MKPENAARERFVEANGLKLHVLEWNLGETETSVVLLHGFLDLAWSFERVAIKLAQRYHVVAPDFRGHGDSAWVPQGGYYYFPDYTADLARLLPQVTRGRVFLVGHSMGGTVATYYTGTFPERVQKLALLEGIGPPAGDPNRAPERMREHVETVDKARAKPLRTLASIAAAAERLCQVHPRLDRDWAPRLAEHATRPATNDPNADRIWKHDPLHRTRSPLVFNAQQYEAFIRRIDCPVLLVNGGESGFQFLHDSARQQLYPNAQLRTLAGAGHMMQLDRPEALADLLLDFLAD